MGWWHFIRDDGMNLERTRWFYGAWGRDIDLGIRLFYKVRYGFIKLEMMPIYLWFPTSFSYCYY